VWSGAYPNREGGKEDEQLEPDRPPGEPEVVEAAVQASSIHGTCICIQGFSLSGQHREMMGLSWAEPASACHPCVVSFCMFLSSWESQIR
jgi:hypothetical protein